MIKVRVGLLFVIFTIISYSKVTISIKEPMRFEDINTRALGDYIVGEGTIVISTDNLEEDAAKKFKLKLPEQGILRKDKELLKIFSYKINDKDKFFSLETENREIKIYAIINRRDLNNLDMIVEKVEGEYKGIIPILIEEYNIAQNQIKE